MSALTFPDFTPDGYAEPIDTPIYTDAQRAVRGAKSRLRCSYVSSSLGKGGVQPCLVVYGRNAKGRPVTRVLNLCPPIPRGPAVAAYFDALTADDIRAVYPECPGLAA